MNTMIPLTERSRYYSRTKHRRVHRSSALLVKRASRPAQQHGFRPFRARRARDEGNVRRLERAPVANAIGRRKRLRRFRKFKRVVFRRRLFFFFSFSPRVARLPGVRAFFVPQRIEPRERLRRRALRRAVVVVTHKELGERHLDEHESRRRRAQPLARAFQDVHFPAVGRHAQGTVEGSRWRRRSTCIEARVA